MGKFIAGILGLAILGSSVVTGISLMSYGGELSMQMPTPYLGNAVFWAGVFIISYVLFQLFHVK